MTADHGKQQALLVFGIFGTGLHPFLRVVVQPHRVGKWISMDASRRAQMLHLGVRTRILQCVRESKQSIRSLCHLAFRHGPWLFGAAIFQTHELKHRFDSNFKPNGAHIGLVQLLRRPIVSINEAGASLRPMPDPLEYRSTDRLSRSPGCRTRAARVRDRAESVTLFSQSQKHSSCASLVWIARTRMVTKAR